MNETRSVVLAPHETIVDAPREMVFQMLTAFGRGRLPGSKEKSLILEEDGDRLVVEFTTDAVYRTYTTVEEVVLYRPDRITFKHLDGPLESCDEVFTFEELPDGRTLWRHTGSFRLGWPVVGGVVGRNVTKRWFERVMRKHMRGMKEAIEARAARSHVFKRRKDGAAPVDPGSDGGGGGN
ncbi:MAG: SRPBCC family protein [Chloroflexi bacterium]|nr:SRPBCC family protein [Chloroflexota bacterium]